MLDPAKRLRLDEILDHPFFQAVNGQAIPKFMPASTLACPPSTTMMNQLSTQGIQLKAIEGSGKNLLGSSQNMKLSTIGKGNSILTKLYRECRWRDIVTLRESYKGRLETRVAIAWNLKKSLV